MLIEKLFTPRWKHKNPQLRKRALLSLNPDRDESQKIYLEVLNTDPEIYIQRIAIQRLNNISQIQSLRDSTKQSEIYQTATERLCELLSTSNKSHPVSFLKNTLSNISENRILEYVALHANDEELQLFALDKIANETVLIEILQSGQFENNKKYALEQLRSANALKRAIKFLKRKNKDLALKAQEMLDKVQEKSKQDTKLQKEYKRVANEYMELINLCKYSDEWAKYESRIRELFDRCRALSIKTGGQLFGTFPVSIKEVEEAFHFFEKQLAKAVPSHSDRPDWHSSESNIAEMPRPAELDRLKEVCERLDQLYQQLSQVEHPKPNIEENIESGLSVLKQNWSELHSTLSENDSLAVYDTELDEFSESYRQTCQKIEKKLADFSEARISISALEAFNSNARLLLESEEPINISDVNALLQSFSPDNIPKNPLIPENIMTKGRELYASLKGQLEQIEKQYAELSEEFLSLNERLEKSLTDGKARAVKQLLNRGRNILKQLPDKYLSQLDKKGQTKKFNKLIRRSDSLLGWQEWSTATVKEQLVKEMETLADTIHSQTEEDVDYSTVAREISQARARWKQATKGIKDQNSSAWEKFDAACNRAYEPCQNYFKKLDEERNRNLVAREKICQDLEKYLETILHQSDEEKNWKALDKIIRVARGDWQRLGVVSRNDRSAISKRFGAVINDLEKLARNRREENKRAKKLLISQVEAALKQLEAQDADIDSAIKSIKEAQAHWKKIGHASKDRQLWNKFKSLCDAIFAAKKSEQDKVKQEEAKIVKQCNDIIERVKQISDSKVDEDLLNARMDVEHLKNEWQALPNSSKNKSLERSFVKACDNFAQKIQQVKKNQLRVIKQQVQENVSRCYQLENLISEFLSNKKDTATLKESVDRLDGQWNHVNEKSLSFTTAIEERFGQLKKYVADLIEGKGQEFEQNISQQHEIRLRNKEELCIQLEILANKESPAESKQKRMQIQVARLAKSMKQHSSPDLKREIQNLLSQWHTSGFILSPESQSYERRFYSALELIDKDYQYPL